MYSGTESEEKFTNGWKTLIIQSRKPELQHKVHNWLLVPINTHDD